MNPKNRIALVVAGLIMVVGIAAFAAVLLTADDDTATVESGGDVVDGAADPASDDSVAVGETFPVEVVGTPLPMLDDPSADAAIGQPMPLIEGRRFDGSATSIGGPTDGPTMYVFLAHWCPHCNDEIPELLTLDERGDLPAGLNVVGISTAVAADRENYPPSQWIIDKGWPWPVMADDELATTFVSSGGSGFPYTVLADADGTVLARNAGSRPADAIASWLADHLA